VDEFHGANAGLVVAEVELASADEEPALPPWIGREVSQDARYFNANLVKKPFTTW
jgi:adenylate cyclase